MRRHGGQLHGINLLYAFEKRYAEPVHPIEDDSCRGKDDIGKRKSAS
jgi:hypothetical protein